MHGLFAEMSVAVMVLWALAAALLALVALFCLKPILLVRAGVWLMRHTFYRLRVLGRENIPATGPALIVCNHVSYLDFVFLLAAQKRYIHFVIFAGWTRKWGLGRLLKWAGVIPIDSAGGPRSLIHSLRQAGDALARGEVVCIFAEGRFTRTGFLLPFHRGFEQIVKNCPAPIVPACLEQVWGSVFSYWGGKLIWKWPQEIPYPVTVAFGKPLPPTATPAEVRLAVQTLSADCAIDRSPRTPPAHRQFIRVATKWRQWRKPCVIDGGAEPVNTLAYGRVLTDAACLASKLRSGMPSSDTAPIGVWLPPGSSAVLANLAVAMVGRPVVNLDMAATPQQLRTGLELCGVRQVIASRSFVSQQPWPADVNAEMVFVDELLGKAPAGQRLRVKLAAWALPRSLFESWILHVRHHRSSDTLALIVRENCEAGLKAIRLTHRNITANVESLTQVIDAGPRDRLLGVLPLSSVLGYTMTLWLPLEIGASVVYHAGARDGRTIGADCRRHSCTIFLATPELLQACVADATPDDFGSLRFLWCGGDSLPAELGELVREKFKSEPYLGFGRAELSPAATLNAPDKDLDGFRQIGNRPGTIGQPLPGVAARIADPATLETLPPGKPGVLLFYGANVMAGYDGDPAATQQAIGDGWFNTGVKAQLGDDGFFTLVSRDAAAANAGQPAAVAGASG